MNDTGKDKAWSWSVGSVIKGREGREEIHRTLLRLMIEG